MWNLENERIAREIGENAHAYVWMLSQETRSINRLRTILSGITSWGPGLGSLLTFLGEGLGVSGLVIAGGVIAGLSTVTSLFLQIKEYENQIFLYKSFASKFSALSNNVKKQLSLPPEEREDVGPYLTWIAKNYDQLVELGPIPGESIIQRYEEMARTNALSIPTKLVNFSAISLIRNRTEMKVTSPRIDRSYVETLTNDGLLPSNKNPPKSPETENYRTRSLRELGHSSVIIDALQFADPAMRYELDRLAQHDV